MIDHPKDLTGKTVKVKLPVDYFAPTNFEPSAENITIEEISRRFNECYNYEKAAKDIMKDNLIFMGYKPPTRWQRFKNRLKDYHQRAKDIWTILTGGDVHKDCGY